MKFRESNIELLKILAMFGIIVCHVYSSFSTAIDINGISFFDEFNFSKIEYFVFQIFITLGYLGNMIFVVCSAWYLIDDEKLKIKKVFVLWLETLTISVIFLLVYCIFGNGLDKDEVISCFLPITRENNWYITAYLALYIIHPILNLIINYINKKQHFAISMLLFFVYFIYDFCIIEKAFYKNDLVVFIAIYFVVSYIKKYIYNDNFNISFRNILLVSSLIFYGMIFINFAIFPIKIKWHVLNNPLLLIMSISLFALFKSISFENQIINKVSSFSLLVYLIHDNIFVKQSTRPQIASYVMNNYGVEYIIFEIIFTSFIIYLLSIVFSMIFEFLFKKNINKLSTKLENLINKYCKM